MPTTLHIHPWSVNLDTRNIPVDIFHFHRIEKIIPYLEESINVANGWNIIGNERFQLVVKDYRLSTVLGDVPKQVPHLLRD